MSRSPLAADADVMFDPVHRELMALISLPVAPLVVGDGLSRPARSAIIFYTALAAWGLVWVLYKAASALLEAERPSEGPSVPIIASAMTGSAPADVNF